MNRLNMLLRQAFIFLFLCRLSTLVAIPSKEVTDQLITELQNIRKTLAHDNIELFEEKDNTPHIPWEETLCRNIVNENKPCTDMAILTNDIQKILYCTHNVDVAKTYLDKKGHVRIGPRIDYTYAEIAERILRLDLYINNFASKAIAYVKEVEVSNHENSPTCAIVIHDYGLKLAVCSMENESQNNQTRTINPFRLTLLEGRILSSICLFSNFLNAHLPENNSTNTTQGSVCETESHKRIYSDEYQANNTLLKNPKRFRAQNEDTNSNDDTKIVQSIAPTASHKPGLLELMHLHAHGAHIISKHSSVMAHEGFRNHFLKMESQSIARTLINQAEKLSMLNGIIWANTESEQYLLAEIPSQLKAYLEEKRETLDSPEIKQNAPSMISIAGEISANVSDLEANHIKPYAQNVERIRQWQQHYKDALNMGLFYVNAIILKDPDHIEQRNALINRLRHNLDRAAIITLPQENVESADTQKILDLQRITLANKTTLTLAGILRIQKMIQFESGNPSDTNDDDSDDNDNANSQE
jgi:hypothetical protein